MIINDKLYKYLRDKGWGRRWYYKSEELKEQADNTCEKCGSVPIVKYHWLVIHHKYYIEDRNPWDYPDDAYQVLCNKCHDKIDHSKIPLLANNHIKEIKKYPFILTKLYYKSPRVDKNNSPNYENITYNKFFDIRFYGRIIDCDYQTRYNMGDGRFDYELIVRELNSNDDSFYGRTYGKPREGAFNPGPTPRQFL